MHSEHDEPRPIIIVKIHFGLGNQLFQYAVARRLAHMANGHLIMLLDDDYEARSGRQLGLQHFNVTGQFVFESTLADTLRTMFPGHQAPMPRHRAVENQWGNFRHLTGTPELAARPYLSFMPDILSWRHSLMLIGLFHDERYFADIRAVIKSDFTLRVPFDQRNREAMKRMTSGPSVFIHVRRGDYLSARWQQEMDGVATADYFHQAFELVKARHGHEVKAFIFSDDPAWVREQQIGGPGAEIIDWNGDMPAHDVMLMRCCTHAIISSSTFSWWGAWLGETPGSTVIAPKPWFRTLPEFTEIAPDRWVGM